MNEPTRFLHVQRISREQWLKSWAGQAKKDIEFLGWGKRIRIEWAVYICVRLGWMTKGWAIISWLKETTRHRLRDEETSPLIVKFNSIVEIILLKAYEELCG